MGTKYVKNNSNLYRHNSLDIQKVMWYCVLLKGGVFYGKPKTVG